MPGVLADYESLFTRVHTWMLMGNQDIGMRYRRSVIGPFWISIAMATMVVGIGTLYAEVMNQPYEEFLTYFGCGILAWTLLSTMINEACGIVVEAEGHLRSVPIPLTTLASRMVYRNFVIFGHNALVVLVMLMLFGHQFTIYTPLVLLGLAAYLPIGVFAALVLGPLCARFRDLTQVVASVTQIMFFLTPIFWVPGSNLSRPIVVDANPFYHLVEVVRRPLIGEAPAELSWIVTLGLLVGLFIASIIVLSISRRKIYLWL
jgi:ABC-type polysaccharide/polyol phosphate export permease